MIGQGVSKGARQQDGLLSIALIFMIIGQGWFAYLFCTTFLRPSYKPDEVYFASWPLVAIVTISLLNLIFLMAIWKWKKWGILGLAVSWIISIVIVSIVQGFSIAPGALFGPVILGFLIKPKWHFFE